MLPISSLEDLALLRETVELECKLAQGQNGQGEVPKDFWPTYSAMANAHGGVVLLGVREKDGVFQLPAPDFRTSETRTTAVLFAHQDFAEMSKPDRIRACYQHCALKYVSNERMSNQSLRERFRLPESKAATASQVIGATKEAGLIKTDESDTSSTRYARYLPFWA